MLQIHHQSSCFLSFVALLMDACGIFPEAPLLPVEASWLGIIQMDRYAKKLEETLTINESKWINFSKAWQFFDIIVFFSHGKKGRLFLGGDFLDVTGQVKFAALLAGILNALSGLQPSLLGSCLCKTVLGWEQRNHGIAYFFHSSSGQGVILSFCVFFLGRGEVTFMSKVCPSSPATWGRICLRLPRRSDVLKLLGFGDKGDVKTGGFLNLGDLRSLW